MQVTIMPIIRYEIKEFEEIFKKSEPSIYDLEDVTPKTVELFYDNIEVTLKLILKNEKEIEKKLKFSRCQKTINYNGSTTYHFYDPDIEDKKEEFEWNISIYLDENLNLKLRNFKNEHFDILDLEIIDFKIN